MESNQHREPWNKGKLVGQKPLTQKYISAIRIQLQNARPPSPIIGRVGTTRAWGHQTSQAGRLVAPSSIGSQS